MTPFSTIIQYIKDIEKLDKFEFAEKVYNETVAPLNKRLEDLRGFIKFYETNGDAIASQRKFDYYMGLVSAHNMVCDPKVKIKDTEILLPQEDANGQPMWLIELKQKIEG